MTWLDYKGKKERPKKKIEISPIDMIFRKLLYRPDEVAGLLSMHVKTIYELVSNGELEGHNKTPGTKGLRITSESIVKYYHKYILKDQM